MIAAAVDWSETSEVVLTSSVNGWSHAVQRAVEVLREHDGHWDAERAGQTAFLGAEEQGVALVTSPSAWRFQRFSLEDYEWVCEQISKGEIMLKESSIRELFHATTLCSVTDLGEG